MSRKKTAAGQSYSTALFGVSDERADEIGNILQRNVQKFGSTVSGDDGYANAKKALDKTFTECKDENERHLAIFFLGEVVDHELSDPFAALMGEFAGMDDDDM